MYRFLPGLIIMLLFFILSPVAAQDEGDIQITDGLKHSVPLEDIIFDDFDIPSRFRPLTEATEADIERLRDRIRPLCHGEIDACLDVEYESVDAADAWLSDDDMVMGYVDADGQAYAYPFKILNFHEIVNDTLAGQPVLISYCPLCNSAVVYLRVLDGETLVFGNTSALYNSDLVKYDQQTDSFWFQVEGRAIVGERTGQQLEALPSAVVPWSFWKETNPDTLVLARPNTGINYSRDVFAGYGARVNDGQFFFPVDEEATADTRLLPAENVLVVESGDEARAYPLESLGNAATTDTIGGQDVVVLSLSDGPTGAAFDPNLDDETTVELEYNGDGLWHDAATGSDFDLNGRAVAGPLDGEQLRPLPVRYTFWFAAVASIPEIEVYTP